MFVPSTDDEPPEPIIEGIAGRFNAITVIDAGITFRIPVRRPPAARANAASSKSRKREFRGLRSYILVASLLDSRRALQCFASLWKSSVRSLAYKPPCSETFCTGKGPVASQPALVARGRRVTTSVTFPEPALTKCHIEDVKAIITPEKQSICLPLIVITPPSLNDVDWTCHNAVPTPQNAAHGKLLTVPDRDLKVINRYGLSRNSFGSSYQGNARLPWNRSRLCKRPSQAVIPVKRPPVAVTCALVRARPFVDEEEDEVDLGPTWSG